MKDPDIERELVAAQGALKKAIDVVDRVRLRRQKAVLAAIDAGESKYAIAKVLGVERPTVESIIKTAEKG